MKRLRAYAPMNRQSDKVTKAAPDFQAVYAEVDARSEGRCEFKLETLVIADTGAPRSFTKPLPGDPLRCPRRAVDHHHTVKPRRNHHDPAHVVHLCRDHHERCEWPYKRGRLVVLPVLGQPGRFTFLIQYAADKFQARGQGA